jgi:hypothetical protein
MVVLFQHFPNANAVGNVPQFCCPYQIQQLKCNFIMSSALGALACLEQYWVQLGVFINSSDAKTLLETCNLNFAVYFSPWFLCLLFPLRSQSSVVSIVTGQWAGQFEVQIQVEAKDFSRLQNIQTDPGAHPASYSVSTSTSVPSQR